MRRWRGPWYSYETIDTAWHVLRDYLAPAVLGHEVSRPEQVVERFRRIRGHAMARRAGKRCLGSARPRRGPLIDADAGRGAPARAGVSVGIEPTLDELLAQVVICTQADARKPS
ncbi:MAG: hypothetical protein M9927_21420 [Anaerolineae bacterium]|nr:hypothetical protein [Anaerolineae bacterium]